MSKGRGKGRERKGKGGKIRGRRKGWGERVRK